ncbi:unnamed protein product, partial [Owenia fusiformis]
MQMKYMRIQFCPVLIHYLPVRYGIYSIFCRPNIVTFLQGSRTLPFCQQMMFELCSISTFILTCSVCISWYIYVLYRRRNVSKPKCAASTMIVLGSGGHTTEMLRLLSGMGDKYYPRYYIIADSDRISQEKAIAFEEKQQINKESQN